MSEIKCPYCNREDAVSDAWELGDGEHEVECENCHKEFIATGETTLEFNSTRLECDQGNHEFSEELPLGSPLPDHLKEDSQ